MRPSVRLSCLDRRCAAYPVAGRTCDPNPALAHVGSVARVRSRACREVLGARDATFPRHPPGLSPHFGCSQCADVSDCAHGHHTGDLALRLCAAFADPNEESSTHTSGTDLAVTRPLADPDY